MKQLLSLAISLVACLNSHAELIEKTIAYQHNGAELEGFHVFDNRTSGKRPGILVVHQWTGLSDMEKQRSRMLAKLGYNVFALDIYGRGIRPQPPEAGTQAGKYKNDRALFRETLSAGLEILRQDALTDGAKLAAIGYCFGGTGVLEMARAGMPVQGVVSFHGGLSAAAGMAAQSGQKIPKILVLHGASDPYVPPQEVADFQTEMNLAQADWQMISYSGAVHAFTQKAAGNDPSQGAAYQESADRRSWLAMTSFFAEIFQ